MNESDAIKELRRLQKLTRGRLNEGAESLADHAEYILGDGWHPKVKEYIDRSNRNRKPEEVEKRNRIFDKVLRGRSGEEQLQWLASSQGMDTEFQAAVSPYMPKGSKIDPSIARLKTFRKEVDPKYSRTRGASWKGDYPEYIFTDDIPVGEGDTTRDWVKIDPDTVNAIQASSANPQLWGHEYRHHEEVDGGSEHANRLLDITTAQNYDDVVHALRSIANNTMAFEQRQLMKLQDEKYASSEYDSEREKGKRDYDAAVDTWTGTDPNVREGRISEEELFDHLDNLWDSGLSKLSRLGMGLQYGMKDIESPEGGFFKRWQERRQKREETTDTPENYREGGRVRLI